MKSYTNIEQSKKLAEILPIESADMGWYYSRDPNAARNQMWVGTKTENADIPCWSLSALLNVLPKGTDIIKEEADTENERYMCTVGIKDDIIPTFGNNPVDACYEMILKLHELNLL